MRSDRSVVLVLRVGDGGGDWVDGVEIYFMKPTVIITPSEYKGWLLRYDESHDHQSDWRASKGAEFVSAPKPEALIWKIDEREKTTVRFSPPIRAKLFGSYSRKWSDVSIHTLADNRVYWRDSDGEHVCGLSDLRPGERKDTADFIADDKHNATIQSRKDKLRSRINKLSEQIKALDKQLHRITDADLMVAAKGMK